MCRMASRVEARRASLTRKAGAAQGAVPAHKRLEFQEDAIAVIGATLASCRDILEKYRGVRLGEGCSVKGPWISSMVPRSCPDRAKPQV